MSTCAPGLNKNNFCNTLYVRTINGRIILYLTGDKFFNFEVSIKSQNVKIQAFWEITRVRNWIPKVRTCIKINIAKWIRTRGYTYTLLLFVSLWHRGNGNHKMRTGAVPLKIRNTLQWDSLFLESSIMIDDRMNKKWRKLFGALFNKLCLTALTYIHNVVRYDGWICCLLRQPIKHRWTSFF